MRFELWDSPELCGHLNGLTHVFEGQIPARVAIPVIAAPQLVVPNKMMQETPIGPTVETKWYDLFCVLPDRAVYFCRSDYSLNVMFCAQRDRCCIYASMRDVEFFEYVGSLVVPDECSSEFIIAVDRIASSRKPKRRKTA